MFLNPGRREFQELKLLRKLMEKVLFELGVERQRDLVGQKGGGKDFGVGKYYKKNVTQSFVRFKPEAIAWLP